MITGAHEFDFALPTRIVFGGGVVDRVGSLARDSGARRVFLVTDRGVAAAGHAGRVEAALRAESIEVLRYDAVPENPTSADVEACRAALGDDDVDLFVAVGGGSSIDVAKGCAFVHAGGGEMRDYHGVGLARGQLRPLFAIPTTAGTGSEVQSFALIADADTHVKMACGDRQAAPKIAILDPELTVSQPRSVTINTGLDALVHSIETAVTTRRTPISVMFSRIAFEKIEANLLRVVDEPSDLYARGEMLLGAALAGIAIEQSMLGAAHSLANPLTARFDVVHGRAVAVMLPHVVAYNLADDAAAAAYASLARAVGLAASDQSPRDAAEALVARVRELLVAVNCPLQLTAHGVDPATLEELSVDASKQWTAQFNPRPVDAAALRSLYEQACRT